MFLYYQFLFCVNPCIGDKLISHRTLKIYFYLHENVFVNKIKMFVLFLFFYFCFVSYSFLIYSSAQRLFIWKKNNRDKKLCYCIIIWEYCPEKNIFCMNYNKPFIGKTFKITNLTFLWNMALRLKLILQIIHFIVRILLACSLWLRTTHILRC